MDNNAQNLTNAQNQPQTSTGPAPRPPMPGPAQMGAAPRPVAPPTPVSAMPNLGGPRPAPATPPAPGAPAAPNAAPGATPANPAAPAGAAPNAAPAGAPKKKGLSKKATYIIIGCVAAVVIIACVIAAVIIMNSGTKKDNNPQPVAVQPQTTELTPIDELDKDGLIEAFDNMQSADYNPGDALTEPLASEAYGHSIMLTDSYADVKDLEDMTDLFDDQYELDVQESDSGAYATIMAVDEDGAPVEGEPLYVAFNEEYAEFDATQGVSTTYVSPETSNPLLVDTSEEFVKEALPIIFLAKGNTVSSIYNIEFETEDEEIVMTVSSIVYNYGSPTSSSSSASGSTRTTVTTDDNAVDEEVDEEETDTEEESYTGFVIEALSNDMTVDLETGVVSWPSDDDGIVNSFSVTQDEFADGFTKMMESIGMGAQADMLMNGSSLNMGSTTEIIEDGPLDEE